MKKIYIIIFSIGTLIINTIHSVPPNLHTAAQNNDVNECKKLLNSSLIFVDEYEGSLTWLTALYLAASRDNDAIVKLLLEHNAKVTQAVLRQTVGNDSIKTAKILFTPKNVNMPLLETGETPLQFAEHYKAYNVKKYLISLGAK